MNQLGNIFGIPVYTRAVPVRKWRQFRFPKSRSKRIRKKWAKRSANWRQEVVADAIMIDVAALRSGFAWGKTEIPAHVIFTGTPLGMNWFYPQGGIGVKD